MKTSTLHSREIIAWLVLACAIAMFSVSLSFAQEKDTDSKKTEVKIRIQKHENGKTLRIDTTVTEDELPALKEYLKELNIDFDAEGTGEEYKSGKGDGKRKMRMHFRHPQLSPEERAELEKELEKLNKELQELNLGMQDYRIEMHGFDDDDPENFDLHFKIPQSVAPLPSPRAFYFNDKDNNGYNFRIQTFGDDIPDSLNNDEHIILYGQKGEDKPVFEKEITGKDGRKIFVYRRTLPKETAKDVSASMAVTRVKAYPNPGTGKFSVSFTAVSRGDVQITITDSKGQEVYSRTLKDFSGEHFDQVDISDKGKGTYFLKISQADESITKKLVVE